MRTSAKFKGRANVTSYVFSNGCQLLASTSSNALPGRGYEKAFNVYLCIINDLILQVKLINSGSFFYSESFQS